MIVFDLQCLASSHRFEGWFGSSQDFAAQQARGLVECPVCGAGDVVKAPMAASLARKGNQATRDTPTSACQPDPLSAPASIPSVPVAGGQLSPEALKLMHKLATLQFEALKTSRWVGSEFAEDARAMHYGEQEPTPIHGQATPDQARALLDEGIAIAPVLFPIAAPDETH